MSTSRTFMRLVMGMVLLLMSRLVTAQEFEFIAPQSAAGADTPPAMRDLAVRILPVYEDKDTERYLANVAALQLVAGNNTAAHDSRQSLRERRAGSATRTVEREILYDIYARARAIEVADRKVFSQAFPQAFREVVPKLSDREAHAVAALFAQPTAVLQDELQRAFDKWRPKGSIPLPDAVDLVWKYLAYDAQRSFRPLVAALDVEEERRRYVHEEGVVIKTRAGVEIHALVLRPKSISTPLPALLEFTIHTADNDARACAAHGYVGVVAYTRGKKSGSANRVIPFEKDGEDARAVIEWIIQQPWSDGRVGMYGEGYSGFAAWAAAKRAPAALKAIATASPMAPGIDFPMLGGVFPNSAYHWAQANTSSGDGTVLDAAQTAAFDQTWFESGKRYRDLDRKFGKPNRVFQRWLNHPSYDRYWQKLIPFRDQFAKVEIPVLTMAGYYAGDAGALHYFQQHLKYLPKADHTLLLGPYGDGALDAGVAPVLRGYPVDASALIDLAGLRFQWFDHIFKNAAKPAVLRDRVNYQVMGANEWRHAASIEAMTGEATRFYLEPVEGDERNKLSSSKPSKPDALTQSVNLADRSSADAVRPFEIIARSVPQPTALSFVSDALPKATELAGQVKGRLEFTPSRMDLDLNVSMFEMLPGGALIQLFDPYEFRASYSENRIKRTALRAGVQHRLDFSVERVSSRRLAAGSRLVVVIGVNLRPDREVNYGAGKDVSEETIADLRKKPLTIKWSGGSYVDLPLQK